MMVYVKTITELSLVVLSGYGLYIHSGLKRGAFRRQMFIYYTNLSNLAVFLFFNARSVLGLCSVKTAFLFGATAEMCITLCIFVTFIIYHFILLPEIKKHSDKYGEFGNVFSLSNIIVHYAVPLTTVLWWLVFAEKDNLGLGSVLCWLALPLIYAAFIYIRAGEGKNIEETNSPYPYGFMDIKLLGMKRTLLNMVIICTSFMLLGMVFVWISYLY